MSFLDKLRAIANNVSKVYNAGYENGKAEGGEGGGLIDPSWTDYSYLFSYGRATNEVMSKLKFSDTSNGTVFDYFFYNSTITQSPLIDTSSGTSFKFMFYNSAKLTTVPPLDVNKGTHFTSMFYKCSSLASCSALNTSNGTEFSNMFYQCSDLVTVSQIDVSKATISSNIFSGCSSLKNVIFVGTIPVNIQFTQSSKLTIDSLKSIITALADYAGTTNEGKYTLTLHATSKTKLETEGATAPNGLTWLAFAESKGWNIA